MLKISFGGFLMRKIGLVIVTSLLAVTLAACGNTNSDNSASSSNNTKIAKKASNGNGASTATSSSSTLDPAHLTPAQNAALVLYYTVEHMPGADQNNYSKDMKISGQGAVVKIYNKDDVPKGEGPLYKDYPDGAELLYSVKLNQKDSEHGIDSTYYTIAGNKTYISDSDAGISPDGVTKAEMVAYAKQHHAVKRIMNVANNTKVQDMRNQSTPTNNSHNLSTQQLGTLVALYQEPDWFKDGISDGMMWYGSNSNGFSYVTANGDPTSWLYFKQNGNDVTIKYVDPKEGQSVAEASTTTKHVTVSGLIRDYYTNQSQKDEVNGYANKLKPESDYNDN